MKSNLFIVESAFASLCYQAAERLLPHESISVTDLSGLSKYLAVGAFDMLVWPSPQRIPLDTLLEADRNARAAQAMFLPIELAGTRLCIGPLFRPRGSCAFCWTVRRRDLQPLDPQSDSTTEVNAAELLDPAPSLATLAISAMAHLLNLAPATSPYLLYNTASRHVQNGYLTGTQECDTCKETLRHARNGNALLQELIHSTLKHTGDPAATDDRL